MLRRDCEGVRVFYTWVLPLLSGGAKMEKMFSTLLDPSNSQWTAVDGEQRACGCEQRPPIRGPMIVDKS